MVETGPFCTRSGLRAGIGSVGRAADRRTDGQRAHDGGRRAGFGHGFRAGCARLRGADDLLCAIRLLGGECLGELALTEAVPLQDHRHLGEPRGLHAALGADPHLLRRAGRRCSAPTCRRACAPPCCRYRAGSARPSCSSSSRPPTRSRGCRRRRSRAATSTPSCRTSGSPYTRRCFTSAMSASRCASPSP